jgi:hypothetical protein
MGTYLCVSTKTSRTIGARGRTIVLGTEVLDGSDQEGLCDDIADRLTPRQTV